MTVRGASPGDRSMTSCYCVIKFASEQPAYRSARSCPRVGLGSASRGSARRPSRREPAWGTAVRRVVGWWLGPTGVYVHHVHALAETAVLGGRRRLQISYGSALVRAPGDSLPCEWQSGAEGSRTLDLLNAMRFPRGLHCARPCVNVRNISGSTFAATTVADGRTPENPNRTRTGQRHASAPVAPRNRHSFGLTS